MSATAQHLVDDAAARLQPLQLEVAQSWWDASTQSAPEADRRCATANLAYRAALADPEAYAAVRDARASLDGSAPGADSLLRRQLDVLHDAFAAHQIPSDLQRHLVELETSVESTFNTFRGDLDGQRVDDNTIAEILRTSDDAELRRRAWLASKQVGAEVADRVRELTKLRNEAARHLGARDHFALALSTGEMDEAALFRTLDAVDRVTAEPFRAWKGELDEGLAARFGCRADELRPWHLDDPFFQDPPSHGAVALDDVFTDRDLEQLTVRTYDRIGLDVAPVLERSDLYAREHKSQHAFCIDMDRAGDVRVLANVVPNERWMETMLHEFGHGTYDREIRNDLPWLLREPAHALTTEGVAMLFGRLTRDPEWLGQIAGLSPSEVEPLRAQLAAAHRAHLLTFARWVLVVTHFERSLYADPDGDLDARWWDLVEHYQEIRRPELRGSGGGSQDWAAKIHLATVPVYYQNYLYGELVASQLAAGITERAGGILGGGPAGRDAAGHYLATEVFGPGASLRWDHLVERATGAPLGTEALAREIAAG